MTRAHIRDPPQPHKQQTPPCMGSGTKTQNPRWPAWGAWGLGALRIRIRLVLPFTSASSASSGLWPLAFGLRLRAWRLAAWRALRVATTHHDTPLQEDRRQKRARTRMPSDAAQAGPGSRGSRSQACFGVWGNVGATAHGGRTAIAFEQIKPDYLLWDCFCWGFASASTPAGCLLQLATNTWPG
jgi:hypothetical protein